MQPKAYRLEAYLPERLVDEGFSWRTLVRLLVGKLARKLTRGRVAPRWSESVVAYYGQIAVFDKPDHHMGGLAFGRDFPRVLNELGIGRRGRMFEFCAGPGYIGYSLLAAGWCESLVLADIDPDSVSTARFTAAHNELEDRVVVYRSDALEQIPDSERWDLVVANPPHFSERNADIRIFDPGWELHRRFYASVASHMNPGGLVVMAENQAGSDPELFEEMIRAGGGQPLAIHPGTDIHGGPNGIYYQLSGWPGLQGPMTGARVSDQRARAVHHEPPQA
jgi:predicted RNA methylase